MNRQRGMQTRISTQRSTNTHTAVLAAFGALGICFSLHWTADTPRFHVLHPGKASNAV